MNAKLGQLDSNSVLEQLPEIVWRSVAGETVLLDLEGSVLMGLNGSAGRMWEHIDGKRSLGELAILLADLYEQDEGQVLQDLLRFAETLLDSNLARVLDAT